MPVAPCGFQLRPVGFFDRNPALDVPPSRGTATPCSSTVEHRAHNPSGAGSIPPGGTPGVRDAWLSQIWASARCQPVCEANGDEHRRDARVRARHRREDRAVGDVQTLDAVHAQRARRRRDAHRAGAGRVVVVGDGGIDRPRPAARARRWARARSPSSSCERAAAGQLARQLDAARAGRRGRVLPGRCSRRDRAAAPRAVGARAGARCRASAASCRRPGSRTRCRRARGRRPGRRAGRTPGPRTGRSAASRSRPRSVRTRRSRRTRCRPLAARACRRTASSNAGWSCRLRADAGQIGRDRDAERPQIVGRPDARAQQQRGGVVGAGAHDRRARPATADELAAAPHDGAAHPPVLDEQRARPARRRRCAARPARARDRDRPARRSSARRRRCSRARARRPCRHRDR